MQSHAGETYDPVTDEVKTPLDKEREEMLDEDPWMFPSETEQTEQTVVIEGTPSTFQPVNTDNLPPVANFYQLADDSLASQSTRHTTNRQPNTSTGSRTRGGPAAVQS